MTKHTQGPWYHTGKEFNDVRDADDELVAVALHLRVGQPERSVQEAAANARLIAAAPELLEALNQLVKAEQRAANLSFCADTYAQESVRFQMYDAMQAAQAAIAKATGGAA